MLKAILLSLSSIIFLNVSHAQKSAAVTFLSLPDTMAYGKNEVSSLVIDKGSMYFLCESRVLEKQPARLFTVSLVDIERKIKDTSFVLPYQIIPITGLDSCAALMQQAGDEYEGLEALYIQGNDFYFLVETVTKSPMCYLLRGKMESGKVAVSPKMTAIAKPRKPDGTAIYNAGFEGLINHKKQRYAFYEYNYFENGSFVQRQKKNEEKWEPLPIQKLPFRITDLTHRKGNNFTAINSFYFVDSTADRYQLGPSDPDYIKVRPANKYQSYVRLINLKIKRKIITWKTFAEIPKIAQAYNWEGIAKYKKGYFLVNDEYTPTRLKRTFLIYLKP